MAILTVANQKGGVGKTTTAVSLAAGLARRGHRVLLVDLDQQASATASIVGATDPQLPSFVDVLCGPRTLDEVFVQTKTKNLFLVPAAVDLAGADLRLAGAMAREHLLSRVLQCSNFDHVVVDTAPYLGLLTLNALVAADKIVVPVSCEYLPILGLKRFGDTLAEVKARLGAPCDVLGYVLTMYDRRERITGEVEAILRRTFGDLVLPTPIRLNTRHKIAPSHKKTIFQFEGPRGRGRADYDALVDEVLRRLGAGAETAVTAPPPAIVNAGP